MKKIIGWIIEFIRVIILAGVIFFYYPMWNQLDSWESNPATWEYPLNLAIFGMIMGLVGILYAVLFKPSKSFDNFYGLRENVHCLLIFLAFLLSLLSCILGVAGGHMP